MKLRSPLGLFLGITFAGLPLAIGTGQAIGIHNTSYTPAPSPSESSTTWNNWEIGNKPDEGRVASVPPQPVKSNKVTRPKAPETNSTRSTVQVQEEPSDEPSQNSAPPLLGSCMRVCPTDADQSAGGEEASPTDEHGSVEPAPKPADDAGPEQPASGPTPAPPA